MKRKKITLPRVTILAYSRRDLVAFSTAVDALRGIAEELRIETAMLKAELSAIKRKRSRKTENLEDARSGSNDNLS